MKQTRKQREETEIHRGMIPSLVEAMQSPVAFARLRMQCAEIGLTLTMEPDVESEDGGTVFELKEGVRICDRWFLKIMPVSDSQTFSKE